MRMMRNRRANKQRLNVHADDIEFTIQEDRQQGICRIVYSRYSDSESKEGLVVQFALLSCWMNQQTGNAIKAYLKVNPNNPMHERLLDDIRTLGIVPARSNFCLTTDGKLIRYGMKPGSRPTSQEQDTYDKLTFFDSKAQAIKYILEEISRYQTIGGLNLVSLNRLPDTVLVESGFEKVEDLMRTHNPRTKHDVPRGVAMWLGNPAKATGVSDRYVDREIATKARRQFLDLLNKMLQ
jgi:hypothetical protein